MITLKNLDKFIESKFQRYFILKQVDLTIEEGEFVTIMGESGAGKTSLLNIIGLLDDLSVGEYFLNDQPIHQLSDRKKADVHKNNFGFWINYSILGHDNCFPTAFYRLHTPVFFG